MNFSTQRARVSDMKEVHGFLLEISSTGVILPRSLSDLYSHTRDFFLLRDSEGHLVGCCALSIVWEDMAEVRSLLVHERYRRQGCGGLLVNACIDDAKAMGIHRVFTLTYKTGFFASLGFKEVGKDILPQKIWADCVHCPKFPDCDEVAMQRIL
ncbi:N-acetyltransferase [Desulfovibrio sp. OttesenSCG-928-G15]|nr:N-acetyltransferase [Desulfovibrio sp. OttesenSCG-928-G15]